MRFNLDADPTSTEHPKLLPSVAHDSLPALSLTPPVTPSSRFALIALAVIVAIGLMLRLYCLGAKNLWLDEMWSLTIARMPLRSVLWSARTQDPNAALYNVLLHFWIWLGESEAVLRGLSLLFGVALIPAIYLLSRRLFHTSVGLLAAALTAVNLFHIQYSQEARAYSLVVLLVTLSSFSFAEYVSKQSRRAWIAYVIFSSLAVYAHIFAVLVLASQFVSLLFLPRSVAPWKRLIQAAAASTLLMAPLAALVYTRVRHPFIAFNWIPRPTARRVYDLFYSLVGNANYYGIPIPHTIAGRIVLVTCGLLSILAMIVACRTWIATRRSQYTWRFALLVSWVFLPIIVVVSFSILFQSWFINRYLLICLPALLIIISAGVQFVRPPWIGAGTAVIILSAQLAGLPQYYRYRVEYQEWNAATAYVLAEQQPGDAAIFCVAHGRMLFDYYRERYSRYPQSPDVGYPDLMNETSDPQALSYFPPLKSGQLEAMIARHRRVWVVEYPDEWAPGSATTRNIKTTLAAAYPYLRETRFYTVITELYSADEIGSVARTPTPPVTSPAIQRAER
jgi:mannosyltransferase